MRWPRRAILIRLAIYVPVIAFLAWRAAGGCPGDQADDSIRADDPPDPRRRVITLPDGSQQEILELSREEAEQILGQPIPEPSKAEANAKAADAEAADATANADTKAADAAAKPADANADTAKADTASGAEPTDAEVAPGTTKPTDAAAPGAADPAD